MQEQGTRCLTWHSIVFLILKFLVACWKFLLTISLICRNPATKDLDYFFATWLQFGWTLFALFKACLWTIHWHPFLRTSAKLHCWDSNRLLHCNDIEIWHRLLTALINQHISIRKWEMAISSFSFLLFFFIVKFKKTLILIKN